MILGACWLKSPELVLEHLVTELKNTAKRTRTLFFLFGACSDARWRPSAGEAGFCQGPLDTCMSAVRSRKHLYALVSTIYIYTPPLPLFMAIRVSRPEPLSVYPSIAAERAERSEASEAAKTRVRTWPHGCVQRSEFCAITAERAERSGASEAAKTRARTWPHGCVQRAQFCAGHQHQKKHAPKPKS